MRIIGHGIDIVEVARIARLLEQHGEQFTTRCFTEGERRYGDAGRRRRAERYAVRFAAKEAVMKVLGTGWSKDVTWHEIEVCRDPAGRPTIRLHERTRVVAAERGIAAWFLSLSHTAETAVASVIGCDEGSVTLPAGTGGVA